MRLLTLAARALLIVLALLLASRGLWLAALGDHGDAVTFLATAVLSAALAAVTGIVERAETQ